MGGVTKSLIMRNFVVNRPLIYDVLPNSVAQVKKSFYLCKGVKSEHQQLAPMISTFLYVSLAVPTTAHAEITPSLSALLNSLVAGGLVLVVIAAAVTAVANF